MKYFKVLGIMCSMFLAVLQASAQNNDLLSGRDSSFLKAASQSNNRMVQLGIIASQRGQTGGVRQLGRQLAQTHTNAQENLASLATAENLALPDQSSGDRKTISYFSNVDASSFDSKFVNQVSKDEERNSADYRSEISGGTDLNLVSYANQFLPVVTQNLVTARTLQRTR